MGTCRGDCYYGRAEDGECHNMESDLYGSPIWDDEACDLCTDEEPSNARLTFEERLEATEEADDPEEAIGKLLWEQFHRIESLERGNVNLRLRARKAAQVLIAEVGADGPMNVEEVAEKAAGVIKSLKAKLEQVAEERDDARLEADTARLPWNQGS